MTRAASPGRARAARSGADGRPKRARRRSAASPAAEEPCLPGLDPTGREERPRALLFGSPHEVLARISSGDPLELRARVARWVGREHRLLDADRLHLAALARVANRAERLRANESLTAFLDGCVADACSWLVDEDRELLERGVGAPSRDDDACVVLGGPLGLDPARARNACTAFNRAEPDDRCAAFALLVEGRSLDDLARDLAVSASEVARRARRALDAALVELSPGEAAADRPTNESERDGGPR